MSFENSWLEICEILGLFVNTLTAHDKYSLLNRDNLTQPIQMQLSEKTFPEFFLRILKSSLNFEDFQKKDDPHSWCLFQSTDSVKQVRSMSNKSCFRGSFQKQHGKLTQTLLKSEWNHHYHIYWPLWRQLNF